MQFIEAILNFFGRIFTGNSFKSKYRVKSTKKLPKILKSDKWQIIDIRPQASFETSHLVNSINIDFLTFKIRYFKHLDKSKKILLVNEDYRSHLDIYQTLDKRRIKTYILVGGYKEVRVASFLDKYTTYKTA
ncbi:rhodanese-like domain-containing protein [Spiroplasma endosymbiont of Panorpa germanica]|uniref:rhodanese-like domain-containing protein n=1 Tax=Spiroplasma endosymbiont of Panorpa germanica TaxID=3066314 RepID=UPI0030CB1463